jgi:hypothetical protein
MNSRNEFEQLIIDTPPSPADWKGHVIAVADTMYLCLRWFDSYMPDKATAADVVAMAKLIIERERAPRNPQD